MNSTVPTIDKKTNYLPLFGLLLLASLLLVRGYQMQGEPWLLNIPLWELQNTYRLQAWLVDILFKSALQLILYLLLGFLAILSFGSRKSSGVNRRIYSYVTIFYATASGIILSIIVSVIASGDLTPNVLDLMLSSVGCVIGAWIGANWLAGGRARKRIWLKLVFLSGVLLLAAVLLLQLAIQKEPSAFVAEPLDSEDRKRLVKLLSRKSPLRVPEGETTTLILSEHDINLLLTWGLSLGSSDRKARISLGEQLATIRGSIGLPFIDGSKRYVNFSFDGWVSAESGRLDGQINRLTIGSVSLPSFLLEFLSSPIIAKIAKEPLLEPILPQIVSTDINRDYVSATYQKVEMPKNFRDKLFSPIGPAEAMRDALIAQFDVIQQVSDSFPQGEKVEIGFFMRPAFLLAYERSENGDPVLENRAAIIALSITIGHRVLARFISDMPYDYVPNLKSQSVTLYRRKDWSQHFLISAALEVISSESISLDIGLLKEELDSGRGGSGFSFADLAADRSGTMFAKVSTSDKEHAELIQLRMIQGFSIGDYVPFISDLPEGIPETQFISDYGGTRGRRYKEILSEIDRRIAECDAYR